MEDVLATSKWRARASRRAVIAHLFQFARTFWRFQEINKKNSKIKIKYISET